MHPTPEHEPARIAVGLDVPAECRDSKHRVAHGGAGGQRSLGHSPEDLELRRGECGGGWRVVIASREVSQEEEAPRDGGKNGERIEETLGAFELTALVLAAGLERLEKLLDGPTAAMAIDGKGDGIGGIDGQVGQQEPFDRRLAVRRLAFEDVNHIERRGRRGDRTGGAGTRQLDGGRGETQSSYT